MEKLKVSLTLLVEEPYLKISVVATKVGLTHSSFDRAFKELYCMRHQDYRKRPIVAATDKMRKQHFCENK